MKKLLALIIAFILILSAGCSSKTPVEEETTANTVANEEVDSTSSDEKPDIGETEPQKGEIPEVQKEELPVEDNKNYGTLNTRYLVDIGCSSEQIAALRGELREAIWADGPVYKFGDMQVLYAFEEYDFGEEDILYIPLGSCTQLSMDMKSLISGAEEYSFKTLEAISGERLQEEYDDFAGSNAYTARVDGYVLKAYADSASMINGNTIITVTR